MGKAELTANQAKYANKDSRSRISFAVEGVFLSGDLGQDGSRVRSRMRDGSPHHGGLFLPLFISFRIMQTMQSDVDAGGAFVRGWAQGKGANVQGPMTKVQRNSKFQIPTGGWWVLFASSARQAWCEIKVDRESERRTTK
jgi:hypothetical protein